MFSSSSSSSDEEVVVFRRRKVYKERRNYIDILNDTEFYDRFRLKKPTVERLLAEIEDEIKLPTNRGGSIKPIIQLLLTLRFYATGSMLITMGDFMGVSKASASLIVERVTHAIATLRPHYVKMPSTLDEKTETAAAFYHIARFPRVVGTIDCTHVKIQSPGGEDGEIYRNRKGFFSLNVQTVSDAQLRIRNIVARWPGSVHDQTIFNNSSLKRQFENGDFGQFLLIGDSGYAVRPYLMTPLQQTHNEAQELYNESLIRTRNTVERQYGVWKRRFPILALGMRLKVEKIMAIIVATAVLHNIAIDMNDELVDPNREDNVDEVDHELGLDGFNGNHAANAFRQLLIDEHFAQL